MQLQMDQEQEQFKQQMEELEQEQELEQLYDTIDIDKLVEMGVQIQDIDRMKEAGITTVQGVQMTASRTLGSIQGLSDIKIKKIKESAQRLVPHGFTTGAALDQQRQHLFYLSTGSRQVDDLLGGGIQSSSLTEVFGEFRTGKTQLAHTLCVMAQLPPEMGGYNGKAAFIDTEGTFRPHRIRDIAERFGVDPDAALENISVARAYNSEHQMDLLNQLAHHLSEEKQYRLIVMDSVIALFRSDYPGLKDLPARQKKLNVMLAKLHRIATEFNVVVYITNQISAEMTSNSTVLQGDRTKPVGGHTLAHSSTTRLCLRKGRADTRIIKIYDSPDVPEAEAMFQITRGGIQDVKDGYYELYPEEGKEEENEE